MSEFVTFKISKKLKEKGYPQHICDDGYITEKDDKYDIGDKEMIWIIPDYLPYIAAPTISQSLKWLREQKNINVEIFLYNGTYSYYVKSVTQICEDLSHQCLNDDTTEEEYGSYEEAALAGIEYCLNNLI